MTEHKNFKKAAGLMLVAILASRFLGLIREMLIARQFGQTGIVSAYYAAFNLPDLLYFFLSSGALSAAFIPVFTERFSTGRQKEAWQIFSIIACFMGLVLSAAVVVFWIFAKPLVSVLAVPGFVTNHPELVPLTMFLTRIILPCQLFFFLGGLMMATLQSRQEFRATAAGPVIYNIGIIFGAIVLSRWFNIAGLAIGTLIGAFAGNVVYAFYWMRKLGFEFKPSLNIRHPGVVRVGQLALPVIFGLGLPQIDVIINRWFASYVSDTAPAALNFANRLMQVPLGIFAQAAGTAILPMLAAYAAQHAYSEMRSGIGYGLRAIMVESIPSTVFMVAMADPLVRTVYMGGEFRPSSVPATVIPLIWYSVGIFAWAGQRIIAPGFFAMQDTITPIVMGTISTVIFIPLNYFLMHTMGSGGIALATTIGISIHFFGMTWLLRRRLNGIEGIKTLKTVGRITVAAAFMAVVCFGVRIGMSRIVGSWQLQDGDFAKPAALARSISERKTPLSDYLYSKLSPDTRRMMTDYENAEWKDSAARKLLVSDLNRIVRGPSIYNSERFGKVRMSDDLKSLAKRNVAGDDLMKLNRELIASAYPSQISWGRDGHWLFKSHDIDDPAKFALLLADPEKPVSRYLTLHFSGGTQKILACQIMPQVLMHDINTATKDELLYTPERFKDVSLSRKLRSLAESKPTGKKMAEANRRLLEAAYPDEIVRRPIDRVESKMGSALTVLVAMLLSGAIYMIFLKIMKVDELDYIWSALRRRIFRRPGGGSSAGGPEAPQPTADAMPE